MFGLVSLCVLALLLTGLLYLLWGISALVVEAISICAIALMSWHYSRSEREKLGAMARGRSEVGICEFAEEFDPRGVDTWIIRAVYEQLQETLVDLHPRFPLRAGDALTDLVGDPEDLEDIVVEIATRTNRSLADHGANPHYRDMATVGDLVQFFNAQPRVEAPSA